MCFRHPGAAVHREKHGRKARTVFALGVACLSLLQNLSFIDCSNDQLSILRTPKGRVIASLGAQAAVESRRQLKWLSSVDAAAPQMIDEHLKVWGVESRAGMSRKLLQMSALESGSPALTSIAELTQAVAGAGRTSNLELAANQSCVIFSIVLSSSKSSSVHRCVPAKSF